MEQPGRLLSLFKKIRSAPTSESALTGDSSVDEVIRTLGGTDLAKLLRFVRDWNTNARSSAVAQGVLLAVVKLRPAQDITDAFAAEIGEADLADSGVAKGKKNVTVTASMKEIIEALIPYTERHRARIDALVQQSYIVDYILAEMDDGMDGIDNEDSMDID